MEVQEGNYKVCILSIDLLKALSYSKMQYRAEHTGVTILGARFVYSPSVGWCIRYGIPFVEFTTLRKPFPIISSVLIAP